MRSIALALALTAPIVGCTPTEENPPAQDASLVGVAERAGDFDTLLTAVEAAGLTDTLQDDGPFTLFAPTDDAFAALPEGTVEALLADIPTLTDLLTYHVVDGEVPASAVAGLSLVTTLNGVDFKVTVDGAVYVNDARVTTTDIAASNGIIHVIDTVLIPPASITDIAVSDPQFSTLVTALTAADLADTLAGDGPFTVFAPTDAAFAKLPEGTVDALLDDIPALTEILLYHVVGERLPAGAVVDASAVLTLEGSSAPIVVTSTGVTVAGSVVTATDIPARNGIIHIIDAVMIPE